VDKPRPYRAIKRVEAVFDASKQKKMKKAILLSLLILFTCATTAQTPASSEHFAKDGLSFDYPAGWTLADKSGDVAQQLILLLQGSSARVQVVVHRQPLQSWEQVRLAREMITTPYVKTLAQQFGLAEAPEWTGAKCITVGKRNALGLHFTGRLDGEPGAADVYTVVLGQRLVHLVYTRADKDDARGLEAWNTVVNSLSVEPPQNPSPAGAQLDVQAEMWGGFLDGKALKKPQPMYTPIAKSMREQGVVVVKIVVDESGKVILARAVSGPTHLMGVSEMAASEAKFRPTMFCGQPIRVSGVITYRFILQ